MCSVYKKDGKNNLGGVIVAMWLSFYNPVGIGDVLILDAGEIDRDLIAIETLANITRIYNRETGETVGYNIDSISDYFKIENKGRVYLDDAQKHQLNQMLYEHGLDPITFDDSPKIVVGYVESCVEHPNSDHLHITQTRVSECEVVQIVCGAQNITANLKVVVALPGAVMPDGLIISSGELRGEASAGMICSSYELGLDPDHQQKGILTLDDTYRIGQPFSLASEE